MKKLIALFLSVFLVSALSAAIISTSVDKSAFDNTFNNASERIWYAQLQPGGSTADTHPDNEFEFGGPSSVDYEGNTTIVDKTNNPFLINVDSAGNLSVTFNGASNPGIEDYEILGSYNTVWVGLNTTSLRSADVIETNTVTLDGVGPLFDAELTGSNKFSGYKFYLDDKLSNIGEILITGNIFPDMEIGSTVDEKWTYTVFATYDPSIIPAAPMELKLTEFTYDDTAGTLTFTWDSTPSATYSINYTEDLTTGFTGVLNASIPSGGASTTHGPVTNPVPSATKLFFKVSENAP